MERTQQSLKLWRAVCFLCEKEKLFFGMFCWGGIECERPHQLNRVSN